MTILCMVTKCVRLAGDDGYCEKHTQQTSQDAAAVVASLREQVRTLTDALRGYHLDHRCGACGGLLEIHHDAICDKCEASNRHASETDALRAQARTLTAERDVIMAHKAEAERQYAEVVAMSGEMMALRARVAELEEDKVLLDEREAALKSEADHLRGVIVARTEERDAARDAALEEAKSIVFDAVDAGDVKRVRGVMLTDRMDALKAQPARRFVEAESYEKLRDLLTRLDTLLDFGEPFGPGEWGIADPSTINALAVEIRAALDEVKP